MAIYIYTHTHTHTDTHTHTCINLAAKKRSGLTSSGQPFNPQANYKPHYVLSDLFPHHINSAMCSYRLSTDIARHRRTDKHPCPYTPLTLTQSVTPYNKVHKVCLCY